MDVLSYLGDIFTFCWGIWNIQFNISGFTFTLANVAEVGIFVWIASYLISSFMGGED